MVRRHGPGGGGLTDLRGGLGADVCGVGVLGGVVGGFELAELEAGADGERGGAEVLGVFGGADDDGGGGGGGGA